MTIQEILSVFASIIGVLIAIKTLFAPRKDLGDEIKQCLEILSKLKEGTENYDRVSNYIERWIVHVCPTKEEEKESGETSAGCFLTVIALLLLLVSFVLFSWKSLWGFAPGIAGILLIFSLMNDHQASKK